MAVLSIWATIVQEYHQLEGDTSHVVNTGWAVLALIAAGHHKKDRRPIEAGVRFLMNSQLSNGDWPQQHISGVFNGNCMITYANYRFVHASQHISQDLELQSRHCNAHVDLVCEAILCCMRFFHTPRPNFTAPVHNKGKLCSRCICLSCCLAKHKAVLEACSQT